jgi:hypothetical protein
MAYLVFLKNLDNELGTLYKIAENQSDFNNLNINKSEYKIIEISQTIFNSLKLNNSTVDKYNGEEIEIINSNLFFLNKSALKAYVENFKNGIKLFTDNNLNHPLINQWNNYYNQLNNLNLDNITYPLNKSLEQYFNDLGQPSLNPLQIP